MAASTENDVGDCNRTMRLGKPSSVNVISNMVMLSMASERVAMGASEASDRIASKPICIH